MSPSREQLRLFGLFSPICCSFFLWHPLPLIWANMSCFPRSISPSPSFCHLKRCSISYASISNQLLAHGVLPTGKHAKGSRSARPFSILLVLAKPPLSSSCFALSLFPPSRQQQQHSSCMQYTVQNILYPSIWSGTKRVKAVNYGHFSPNSAKSNLTIS